MYKTIVEAVLRHAIEIPDKTAVIFKNETLTYAELAKRVKTFAAILAAEYGVKDRQVVMLTAVSKPEYIVGLLAIQYLGAVSVPVDKSAIEENIVDVYLFNGAELFLSDMRIANETVRRISLHQLYEQSAGLNIKSADSKEQPEKQNKADSKVETIPAYKLPAEDTVAEMLFTTGTTGKPKGAMLSYRNLYASTHNTWLGVGMLPEDKVLLPLPLNHSVGMRVLRTILYIGATVVIQNGFAFPKELKKNVEEFSCTGFVCVPAVLERLYRQMGDDFTAVFSQLRYMEIGAGSLSYDMKKKLIDILPNTKVTNTWGSTETGGAIFLNVSEHPEKLTALGKPVPGILVSVVDPDGHAIEARDINTAGRMILQGPMQMMGYYRLEEQTKDALRDGWLFTNDLVYTDEDGFVYMIGRADDIINVGGEKVSPIEVENIASLHPELLECGCIGVEDPEGILGQIPVLYYVPEEGMHPDPKEMVRFLSDKMEAYKIPKQFIQITELPRNRMKKLDRKKLHALWKENGTESLLNPVVENILSRQSIRVFEEKEIPKPILEQLLSCAIQAPSANNMQTWRFTVIRNKEVIARLKNVITETIASMEGKKPKFYGFNNPDTVVLISNDKRNDNGPVDCAVAAENLMLSAGSFGIGSVWNNALKNICDKESIRSLLTELGIGARHIVYAAILLGYPKEVTKKIERRTDVIKWI